MTPVALTERFAVCAASIAGREHLRLHRNNQDAVAVHADSDCVVAVVADGCSSGAFNELGARYAATWIARELARRAIASTPSAPWVDRMGSAIVEMLARLAAPLGEGADLAQTVHDYFLFSFLAAVVTRERAIVFGMGDGYFAVDGRPRVLDPGPDNAPPYIGYALLDPAARTTCTLHHDGPSEGLRSLVIGTDGIASLVPDELREMEQDRRYVKNPSLLQKRLVVLGANEKRLQDDATLALIRTRDESQP